MVRTPHRQTFRKSLTKQSFRLAAFRKYLSCIDKQGGGGPGNTMIQDRDSLSFLSDNGLKIRWLCVTCIVMLNWKLSKKKNHNITTKWINPFQIFLRIGARHFPSDGVRFRFGIAGRLRANQQWRRGRRIWASSSSSGKLPGDTGIYSKPRGLPNLMDLWLGSCIVRRPCLKKVFWM